MEMTALWIGAIIVFGVVEALTAGLVSIWFVPGAAAGLIAAMAGAWHPGPAGAVPGGVRGGPGGHPAPGAEALRRQGRAHQRRPGAGEQGKVTETIDNDNSTGAVYVDGKTWTARSADGAVIPAGSQVRIERMEGVKLLVRELAQKDGEERGGERQ